MRQARITTWDHRPGVWSWQLFTVDDADDTGEYVLVRRGQSNSPPHDMVDRFLATGEVPDIPRPPSAPRRS